GDITELKTTERLAEQRADQLTEEHHRKDEVLAMLGHELRNPVSAIAHGLELLDRGSEAGGRGGEIRALMTRQTRRIARLLDQLLDISRVLSGKVVFERHPLDLTALVRTAVETAQPLAEAKGQTLVLASLPDESIWVVGDALRLSQVLDNLL